MSEDFYCDEALSDRTRVEVVVETDEVLAFRHTRPFWPVHIVVIPKRHVPSLTDLGDTDEILLHKVLAVVRRVADQVMRECGACRVLTNLGCLSNPRDDRALHRASIKYLTPVASFDSVSGSLAENAQPVRKLPRQVDTSKLDSAGAWGLGRNTSGGTWLRLSWGRPVL